MLIETPDKTSVSQVVRNAEKAGLLKGNTYKVLASSPVISQQLSHQKIIGRFINVGLIKGHNIPGYKLVPAKQLSRYAFPRLINAWLEKE